MKAIQISKEDIENQFFYMEKVRTYWGTTPRYAMIQTYGCQQNEADSERLAGMVREMGYTLTDLPEKADLILVNTCAVREHAELKVLSITGEFKHLKKEKPSLILGVCGCMVSKENRSDDLRMRYPYVNFTFGTGMLYRFPELLFRTLTDGKRRFLLDPPDYPGNIAEGLPVERVSSFKAWVSISYGCNNFCTYCIVPYVRGRERSREPQVILSEVAELVKQGYKEITLLGQNVNSYGKDLDTKTDFASLLSDLCKIDGDFQIRFMTSHPKDVSDRLIETMAKNPKMARHFHLPLQSGSNEILKKMNRHYTVEDYLKIVGKLRAAMPDIAITSDIIVGFPGETEEDFQKTLDALRQVEYDNLYSFIYSPREGTPAAKWPQIPREVSVKRFQQLLDLQSEISHRKNESYVGKQLKVLVEERSKTNAEKLTGRTEFDRLVHFAGDDSLIGKIARIKIEKADTYTLSGTLVSVEEC